VSDVPLPVPHEPARPAAERFAARTAGMTASEIRALFAVASRPEVVSLAGGMPNIAALPLEALAVEVADLVSRDGQVALQYGSAQGVPQLREQICEVMACEGIRADPSDVVVTVGSQMALDLITRIYCDPGDVVLAEGPSYVGALGSFAAYQARVVHVAMDDDGLVPAELAATLTRLAAAGKRVKFLYTVPNFHNPAGVSLSLERRAEILEICHRADVLIVEDNPYGLLGFDGEPRRALRHVAQPLHGRPAQAGRAHPRAGHHPVCHRLGLALGGVVQGAHLQAGLQLGGRPALLDHVRQLVCQQQPARRSPRSVSSAGEDHVSADGVRPRPHRPRRVLGLAVRVHPHVGEGVAEARLHEGARRRVQGPPRRGEHPVHAGRRERGAGGDRAALQPQALGAALLALAVQPRLAPAGTAAQHRRCRRSRAGGGARGHGRGEGGAHASSPEPSSRSSAARHCASAA